MTQQNWKVTLRLGAGKTYVRNAYADDELTAVRAVIWNCFNRSVHVEAETIVEGFYTFIAKGRRCHADVAKTDETFAINYVPTGPTWR